VKTIRWTSAFKADYKRTMRSHRFRDADAILEYLSEILSNGEILPAQFHDHPMGGNWKGHRDCHLYPDLVLIRREESETEVAFVRMGTHSELFD
jgi:mRNA interferase YafQ